MKNDSYYPGIFAAALAALSLLSCTQDAPEPEDGSLGVDFFIETDIRSGTRATDIASADESKVNRWALFLVKDGQASIFTRAWSDSGADITLDLNPGTYTAYAVVNYPASGNAAFAPGAPSTVSELTGTVSHLRDNSASNLVMSGSKRITVAADRTGSHSIPVSRLVAKLGIRKITVDFSDNPALASKDFTLKGLYVTNAYSHTTFGADYTAAQLTATPSSWYNRMGFSPDADTDGLLSETGLDIPIGTSGGSYVPEHWFYCYQNPVLSGSDTRSPVWTKRCTRIVIEVQVGGTTYYYPVTVASADKGILRNKTYFAEEVIIRRIGSKDPEDENPDAVSVKWSTATDGWDETYRVDEIS
ncbi:MAG: hypothetical protein IJ721_02720 [Bacteroidales bacterium]|nr:hypothetical protein [Bacteroidales bacterium]